MLDAAVPGDGSGTFSQHGRRWHHAFHQTPGLPERLIAGGVMKDCGHWIAEEQPERLTAELLNFLD